MQTKSLTFNIFINYSGRDKTAEVLIEQIINGGDGEIRTLDTLLTHTHFPGVRFQPLTHVTVLTGLN